MEMTLTDAAESLLSVNSMIEKGHEVHFTKGESYLVMSSGETMPLEKHGKRWYLRVGQGRPCEKRIPSTTRGSKMVYLRLPFWKV